MTAGSKYIASLSNSDRAAHYTRFAEIQRRMERNSMLHVDQVRWLVEISRKAIAMGDIIEEEQLKELEALEKSLEEGTFNGTIT